MADLFFRLSSVQRQLGIYFLIAFITVTSINIYINHVASRFDSWKGGSVFQTTLTILKHSCAGISFTISVSYVRNALRAVKTTSA